MSSGSPADAIPDLPEGDPFVGAADADEGTPVAPVPPADFWRVLYERRSIRRFDARAVPRELAAQVVHAGIWAPSSCNYQMWDFVVVDDPAKNAELAAIGSQMGNAPVNIVVAYGRDFSEDAWANIQSASAAVENMSLAAHALGLGTFWITQTGDPEKLRRAVGLPQDRLVVAVLALGWPKNPPRKGPKRRPLSQVAHWNSYGGRPIPGSPDPEAWDADLLRTYQRARVLNGLRHNKPRAFEVEFLEAALARLLPSAGPRRWLDVLPCTGIVLERVARLRPELSCSVVERSAEVAEFAAARALPRAERHLLEDGQGLRAPPEAGFDLATCFFRLEGLAARDRQLLLTRIAGWLAPGGRLLACFVNSSSYHALAEKARAARGGLGGVEYVLSPDPGIGPFKPLSWRVLGRELEAAGFAVVARHGAQVAPPRAELDFRLRNFGALARGAAGLASAPLRALDALGPVATAFGRFQAVLLEKRAR
jgi:nitroreductase/SAM-dependent methyltransferase